MHFYDNAAIVISDGLITSNEISISEGVLQGEILNFE